MNPPARRNSTQKWLKAAVHLVGVLPLIYFFWQLVSGQLGFNPVETALRQSGRAAVIMLLLSLTITPVRKIFNLPILAGLRKPLGLYAALYAVLHFLVFAVWDYGLNFSLILNEFAQKPFLLLGLGALLILLILALTSNRTAQRKCRAGWRRLHRAVYLAALLAIAHYLLSVKGDLLTLQGDYTYPLIAGSVLLLLFLLRVPALQHGLQRLLSRN